MFGKETKSPKMNSRTRKKVFALLERSGGSQAFIFGEKPFPKLVNKSLYLIRVARSAARLVSIGALELHYLNPCPSQMDHGYYLISRNLQLKCGLYSKIMQSFPFKAPPPQPPKQHHHHHHHQPP